jgi:hypothetical protein
MTLLTKDPRRTRSVATLAAASIDQHSSIGSVRRPRLTKWSQIQTESNPAASARRAASSHQSVVTATDVRLSPIGIAVRVMTSRLFPWRR